MHKNKRKKKSSKARYLAIWLVVLGFMAGALTIKDSIRLFLADIPEMLRPTIQINPKNITHVGEAKAVSYIVAIQNTSDEVKYDVQFRILLGDMPFEAFTLIPLSGPEAEKKTFPEKAIAINPFLYGIYGVNEKRQNVAYFVFKKFDPKETKTVELGIYSPTTRELDLQIKGMTETPSPYTENSLNHRFRERMSVTGVKYYGTHIEQIKEVRLPPPQSNIEEN